MLLTVPVTVVLGLLIAVLLNQSINGKTVFRAIYFLPMVVAPAAVAWYGNGCLMQNTVLLISY